MSAIEDLVRDTNSRVQVGGVVSTSEIEGRSFLLIRLRLGLCFIAASSIVRLVDRAEDRGVRGNFSLF